MQILSCSLDVSKIDKAKLIQGKNGVYFNFDVVIKDEKDQFGKDVAISVSQTKEEREAKSKKVYCGSGKVVWKSEKPETKTETINHGTDSLPF